MTNQIEDRIKALILERKVLETTHNLQVQENQKINQEFQQTVAKNQTLFAQLTGAINELSKLKEQTNECIVTNSSYTSTSGNSDRVLSGVGGDRGDRGPDLRD
jgi:hypothetical protein